MKVTDVLWILVVSALLALPTPAVAQVREVQPRGGQPGPGVQPSSNAPPQLRQVAPRGSRPQAAMSRSADQQAPKYQAMQQIARRWKLGIDDSDSPQGVRVAAVYRGTPASVQLGLERGDYILDVQGYPVGYYQGVYYELSYMLNLYADQQGWVNINIWNFRTGRANPYWVQLRRQY